MDSAEQKRIDRIFDVCTKSGLVVIFFAMVFGLIIGIDRTFPLLVGGALTVLAGFLVDILFSPRWKR